ncbi:hypothetical protein D3C85_1287680 [compost metagenome]
MMSLMSVLSAFFPAATTRVRRSLSVTIPWVSPACSPDGDMTTTQATRCSVISLAASPTVVSDVTHTKERDSKARHLSWINSLARPCASTADLSLECPSASTKSAKASCCAHSSANTSAGM